MFRSADLCLGLVLLLRECLEELFIQPEHLIFFKKAYDGITETYSTYSGLGLVVRYLFK